MKNFLKLGLFVWLLNLFLGQNIFAQKRTNINELKKRQKQPESIIEKDTFRYQKLPYDTIKYSKGDLIELLSGATQAEGFGYDSLVKVVGRNITFKQGDRFIFCDSAYFYPKKNFVKAMGNVQIAEEGASTISARTMDFDANSGTLMARGDANFSKGQTNLRAPAIDYNVNSKIAYYFGNGTLTDGQNQLTSESGSYDSNSKNLFARKNVRSKGISEEGEPYEINSDTLTYNDFSKVVKFLGKEAKVSTKEGTIYASDGEFNTKTKKSKLKGRPRIETDEYILKGDFLDYDQIQQRGEAKGNAEIFSKKDNIYINAHEGKMNGKQGISRFYGGRAYMRMIDEKNDTLWVVADTLISVGTKFKDKNEKMTQKDSLEAEKQPKMMLAYYNVKIYKSDLQGLCDSLAYNMKDSIINFYRQPVLWNVGNQISADSIRILNKNNKPHKIVMRENSFIISLDSIGNYNQMKGKYIDAFLKEGKMDKVFVEGNSESIYFQLKEDNKTMTGMYKVICGSVKAEFEENELSEVTFYHQIDGDLIPPHELQEGAKRLPGFLWRDAERPNRKTLFEAPKPRLTAPTTQNNAPQNINKTKEVNNTKTNVNPDNKTKEEKRNMRNTLMKDK
jgi:lipopolysaccharide export system protein LptA